MGQARPRADAACLESKPCEAWSTRPRANGCSHAEAGQAAITSSRSRAQPGGPEGRSHTTAGSRPIAISERPRDHRPLVLVLVNRGVECGGSSASRPQPGILELTMRTGDRSTGAAGPGPWPLFATRFQPAPSRSLPATNGSRSRTPRMLRGPNRERLAFGKSRNLLGNAKRFLVPGMDAGEMPRTMRCRWRSRGTSHRRDPRSCFIHTWYDADNHVATMDNNGSGATGSTGTPGVPDVVLSHGYDVFNNLIGRVDTTYESDGVTVVTQTTGAMSSTAQPGPQLRRQRKSHEPLSLGPGC